MRQLKLSPLFTVLALLSFASFAHAANYPSCSAGHWYYKNTLTPMVETNGNATTINHDGQWVTVMQSCDDEFHAATGLGTYSAVWRQYISIDSATVAVGTQYEVEFATTKSGVTTVHQVVSRKIRMTITSTDPQSDYLGAYLGNLTGANGYRVRMRLVGSSGGNIHVGQIFATAQGSASYYGSGTNTISSSMTLDSTWREIGIITVNNASGAETDVQLQGHFTINSGTAGQKISLGFGKGNASSGSHYSNVYVPATLPDNVTAFDFIPNEGVGDLLLPNGSTDIRVWAKVNSGTVTISNRRIEVLAMDAAPADDSARMYTFSAGPTTHSEDTTAAQPQACIMVDRQSSTNELCTQSPGCGKWTKLLEMDVPANAKWEASVGGGYVEIIDKACLGGGSACWSNGTRAQVAIETITYEPTPHAVDFHMTAFSIPNVPVHHFFFEDAFSWGNDYGQKLRLWIRLIDYPCGVPYEAGVRQLTIGRRYLGLRFFERSGDLYYPQ